MSRFSKFLDAMGQAFGDAPSAGEDLQKRMHEAKNPLDVLREYNADPAVIRKSKETSKPRDHREWLLNSFQYARQAIEPSQTLELASYLNTNDVFNRVAPDFYGGTTWSQVVYYLTEKCPDSEGPNLLSILEERGHLQGCVRESEVGGNLGTMLYFDNFTANLTTEDAIALLTRSESFQIVRQGFNFAVDVQNNYPQFKPLLG